jgi:hypothetical protein
MEQNDDNLSDYLNNADDGDFDNLLKEKIKEWKTPNDTEILANQVEIPLVLERHEIDSNVVSAEEDSKSNSLSQETQGAEVSNESSDAQDAGEPSTTEDSEDSEPSNKRKLHERPTVEHVPPVSDPEFSRQIIEGKIPQVKIRGIKQGPWAKPETVAEALPHEEVLEKLGFSVYGRIWRNARNFYVRKCGDDVEKLIAHINRLEGAVFITKMMIDSGTEHLKEMLEGLSEVERKRAEELLSKVYREKSERAHPGRSKKSSTGNGEVKEVKVKKLAKGVRDGLDQMIDGLKASYETMVEMVKNQPDAFLKLEYLKEKFGKGEAR